jgi:hypothetical protein
MRLRSLVQRRGEKRCTASGQSEPRRADADEPIGEHVDMRGGEADQFARRRIVPRCMLENIRSQRAKIAGRSCMRPIDDSMRVVAELLAQRTQQSGRGNPAIERPQQPADGFAAEPGPAALIGNRHAPSADPMGASADNRPADAARAGDDHAAVGFPVRANAGRVCVGGDHGAAKRMRIGLRCRQMRRLAGAGQRQTGDGSSQIRARQAGLLKACGRRRENLGEALLYAEQQIGRPGGGFAKHLITKHLVAKRLFARAIKRLAGKSAQPRAAARATAVDAEQQDLGVHLTPSPYETCSRTRRLRLTGSP